jgi:uncharacterized membrane protein (DUF485 family)
MRREAAAAVSKVNAGCPVNLPLPNRGRVPNLAPLMTEKSNVNWAEIEAKPAFRSLLGRKAKFIVIATVFFMIYYLALPILVGYWPDLMKKQVWGKVNIAYVFALSQFFMAWIVAFIYVRVAAKWDKEAAAIIHGH